MPDDTALPPPPPPGTGSLVDVGPHRLDFSHVDAILAETIRQSPPDKPLIIGFGLDLTGAEVALVFTKETPHAAYALKTAFGYSWSGGAVAGAYGQIAFGD